MPRTRIEGLLAAFPKLLSSRDQHTFVETENVRYVYKPLEDMLMVLITNKQSNILQDIETLHLFSRVVSDNCRTLDEKEIVKRAFELIAVFDEIVSLGLRESISLNQIRTIIEMESQEERIQAEVARQKEKEAKEESRRKIKMLELQKKEAARRGYNNVPLYNSQQSSQSSYGDSYSKSYTSQEPSSFSTPSPSNIPSSAPSKGKGMQLGRKKSNAITMSEVIQVDEGIRAPMNQSQSQTSLLPRAQAPSFVSEATENVCIVVEEKISVTANKDGGMENLEIKGDLMLNLNPSANACLRICLAPVNDSTIQFKTHPNVNKQLFASDSVITLKDPSKPFPTGQSLGVLKWRYSCKDESEMPLAITCWPTQTGPETFEVNMEYELQRTDLQLQNVVISIPIQSSSPPSVSQVDGTYKLDRHKRTLDWEIASLNASNATGTLEFVASGTNDPAGFFPVQVNFESLETFCKVKVESVQDANDGTQIPFEIKQQSSTEEYAFV